MKYIVKSHTLDKIVSDRKKALSLLTNRDDMRELVVWYKETSGVDLDIVVESTDATLDEVVCYSYTEQVILSEEEAEDVWLLLDATRSIVEAMDKFDNQEESDD